MDLRLSGAPVVWAGKYKRTRQPKSSEQFTIRSEGKNLNCRKILSALSFI